MTKVKQTFEYIVPEGKEFIDFHEWAGEFLEQEEYNKWYLAQKRQNEIMAAKQADDKMTNNSDGSITWDENTVKYEQPADPEWLEFWERYLDETGIEFNSTLEEVND
jgi:hypothetical protein